MASEPNPVLPTAFAPRAPQARLLRSATFPQEPALRPSRVPLGRSPSLGSLTGILPAWGVARRLAGRTVIVSGTSGDAPRVIACALLREGASVAVVSPEAERVALAASEAASAGASQCCAIPADASAAPAFRDAVGRTLSLFGGVDALINDASGAHPTELADGALSRVEEAFERTRAAVSHLRPGGCVITTLASASYREVARLLEHTRAWAVALRQRYVRVNGVAPRLVAAELDRTVCWLPSDGEAVDRGIGERCVQILLDDSPDATGHVFPAE
jgi:NAD(P)-dependent dehydrogenase (short-subunit alcohol dehydrogenase family)